MEGIWRTLIFFFAVLLMNFGIWKFFSSVSENLGKLERQKRFLLKEIARKENELKSAIKIAKKRQEVVKKYLRFANLVPTVEEADRNLFVIDFVRQIKFQGLSLGKAKFEFSHGKGEDKISVWSIPFSYSFEAPWPEVVEKINEVGGLQTPFVIDRVSLSPTPKGLIRATVKGRIFFFVK